MPTLTAGRARTHTQEAWSSRCSPRACSSCVLDSSQLHDDLCRVLNLEGSTDRSWSRFPPALGWVNLRWTALLKEGASQQRELCAPCAFGSEGTSLGVLPGSAGLEVGLKIGAGAEMQAELWTSKS